MLEVRLHKDFNPEEFKFNHIEKAWIAINGTNSAGVCFYIARLIHPFPNGSWMAYLRRPDKKTRQYEDRPFNYEGYSEAAYAEEAVFKWSYEGLSWRITEMPADKLPIEFPDYLK